VFCRYTRSCLLLGLALTWMAGERATFAACLGKVGKKGRSVWRHVRKRLLVVVNTFSPNGAASAAISCAACTGVNVIVMVVVENADAVAIGCSD
ncbi:hypothetical protein BX661DRAFT_185141, partial [Kickxella alabastrina]|uniref:uncharacterized protein n=1 Tax=Kickxella alabastrina TaxID=61397 RepID=UPI0022208352